MLPGLVLGFEALGNLITEFVLFGGQVILGLIIFGRVIQGFAAGILQPLVMVLLFQFFPPEKRGSAMGMFSMGVVFALGLGPAIGGLTIDRFL